MKKLLTLLLVAASFVSVNAQVSLINGWKFKTGDSSAYAAPVFDDHDWQPIDISKSWETQGHEDYDGPGWYRLHVVIPSALKDQSYFKDSLRFEMGYGDDGYAIYLNGHLIGKNFDNDIRTGLFGDCAVVIPTTNPAILWDKDNVLAVRVFDTGGNGGIYGDTAKFKVSMVDLVDYISINHSGNFSYGDGNTLSKTVSIETGSRFNFAGKFQVRVTDPIKNTVLFENSTDINFAKATPFTTTFTTPVSQNYSCLITYKFIEAKTGKEVVATEGTPYILTPYVSAKPKINGASVYGERPEKPFLYKIPATGHVPLIFSADSLPTGLSLDKGTGIITGTVAEKGDYQLTLTVHNHYGTATKKFTIKIGDTIGLTPALGWNSWNAFGLTVTDAKVRVAAKTIATKLSAHGWSYVNIDDGWEAAQRAAGGEIVPNQKFPDMHALADYIHSLGLKFGIYSSPGPQTCGGYLGSYQHEEQDAQSYANWGVDYLKYDWCSYASIAPQNPGLGDYKKPYQVMRAALDKVPRDIMFSFCQYGMGDSWNWAGEVGGNSWRTTDDIRDNWKSMTDIGFHQQDETPHARPGHFNDPDMLVVGLVGWGDDQHYTYLTPDEQYTHISLWSMLASPLLIGCDLGHLDRFTLNLLTNDEVIAINQDALGHEAQQIVKTDNYLVYVKDLEDGSKAVAVFNTSDKYQSITLNWAGLGISGYTKVRDVWRQKYLITNNKTFTTNVAPHGVTLVKLAK
jgi:alpha-galactosidase